MIALFLQQSPESGRSSWRQAPAESAKMLAPDPRNPSPMTAILEQYSGLLEYPAPSCRVHASLALWLVHRPPADRLPREVASRRSGNPAKVCRAVPAQCACARRVFLRVAG